MAEKEGILTTMPCNCVGWWWSRAGRPRRCSASPLRGLYCHTHGAERVRGWWPLDRKPYAGEPGAGPKAPTMEAGELMPDAQPSERDSAGNTSESLGIASE